ncbi:unnamed protein product [Dicrocoelium dendriticum]|nr:unnamed protein product [Dicrocoelium dendriticum]
MNNSYVCDNAYNPRSQPRPKLNRQSSSFISEGTNISNKPLDQSKRNTQMDEFDYFCQIANSPSGSKVSTHNSTSSLIPSRQVSAMRSHSMRSASPDDTYLSRTAASQLEEFVDSSKSGRLIESPKITHLKPPSRGQLRRASTDESGTHSLIERGPVAATLSYSSVHTGMQNLCKSPPTSVPMLPPCQGEIVNPSVPLGVPLSPESLMADEPGMTYYQVQILGASGVGKTALCQQLARLTASKTTEVDLESEESNNESHSITAAFEGSVYTINFVDTSAESFEQNLEIQVHDCIDAFIVVYAIDDSMSFDAARLIIQALVSVYNSDPSPSLSSKPNQMKQAPVPVPIYLVANKTDLVRGRQISSEGN